MTEHKTWKESFPSIDQRALARQISLLRYEDVAEFVSDLENEITIQAEADLIRGRSLLSSNLRDASVALASASGALLRAWRVCAPRMKKKVKVPPAEASRMLMEHLGLTHKEAFMGVDMAHGALHLYLRTNPNLSIPFSFEGYDVMVHRNVGTTRAYSSPLPSPENQLP